MTLRPLLAASAISVLMAASAEAGTAGHYLAVLGQTVTPDSSRDNHQGYGFDLIYGLPVTPALDLELRGGSNFLHRESDSMTDSFPTLGAALRFNIFPNNVFKPFLLGGLGVAKEDEGSRHDLRPYGDFGAGLTHPLYSNNLLLRAEARYHLVYGGNQARAKTYSDVDLGLGLQYFFSASRRTASPLASSAGDQDRDGVNDASDRCPASPAGGAVDAGGCAMSAIDSDLDGVADLEDICPATPASSLVGANGCRVVVAAGTAAEPAAVLPAAAAPAPATAATPEPEPELAAAPPLPAPEPEVAATPTPAPLPEPAPAPPPEVAAAPVPAAAPEPAPVLSEPEAVAAATSPAPAEVPIVPSKPLNLDADGDGVLDGQDLCPGTPKGLLVGADGCLIEQTTVLPGVEFENNSDRLTASAKDLLRQVAASLKVQPAVTLEISGHTDSLGPQALNLTLSLRRAKSVKNFLVAEGVADGRLESEGYGEFIPLDTNETEAGRAKNRRVEFKVLQTPAP